MRSDERAWSGPFSRRTGYGRRVGVALDSPLGRARHRVQCAARSARSCTPRRAASGRCRPSNALGALRAGAGRFFRKEFQACRTSAEQALALNPMDGGTMAFVGVMLAYSGDWQRGCGLVERAATLNPRHPGWYWFPLFLNAYRKSDYADAVAIALKINLPGFYLLARHDGGGSRATRRSRERRAKRCANCWRCGRTSRAPDVTSSTSGICRSSSST